MNKIKNWSIDAMDIFTFLISRNRLIEACKMLENHGMTKKGAFEYVQDYRRVIKEEKN